MMKRLHIRMKSCKMELYGLEINSEYEYLCYLVKSEDERMVKDGDLNRRYDVALRNIYDELYELNITQNSYRIVYCIEGKYVTPAQQGCLSETVLQISREMVFPEDVQRFLQFFDIDRMREKFKMRDSLTAEFRKLRKNGEYRWAQLLVVLVSEPSEDEIMFVYVMDVDEKKRAQELEQQNILLRQREIDTQRNQIIIERSKTMIIEWNVEQKVFYVSPEIAQFVFFRRITPDIKKVYFSCRDVHIEDWPEVRTMICQLLKGKDDIEFTARLLKEDGCYLWCRCTATVVSRIDGKIIRMLITVNDTDALVRAQRALAYRAEYDALTGYGNFDKYKHDIKELLAHRGDRKYSLWYGDLKNFKYINDIYGYDVGDKILRFWADIIAEDLREGEAFARVSADNFTALRYYEDSADLETRFQRELSRISQFEELKSKKFLVEIVSGIYCIEKDSDLLSIEDMIDRANMAQKSVKSQPGSRISLYSEKMRSQFIWEKAMEAEMDHALHAGEFHVYLQGQVDIQRKNVICGAEALVRWIHPVRGMVPPSEFIPLFEKNGFVVELDRFVFEEVCRYIFNRIKNGERLFKVAVNASRLTLLQPDFIEKYTRIKEQYKIPDNLLELECTETVLIENLLSIGDVSTRLRESGFLIGMDDFGSGYSSLNVLKDVVVDILKLDMDFFQNGLTRERDRAIVSSIISMAGSLDMLVVAEGVETMEQVDFLRQIGCDIVQGYVFCRPIPIGEFSADLLFEVGDVKNTQIPVQREESMIGVNSLPEKELLCAIVRYANHADMTIQYTTPNIDEVLGYTLQELQECFKGDMLKLICESDVPRVQEALAEFEQNLEYSMEYRIIQKNGEIRWMEDRRFSICPEQERCAISVLIDITPIKLLKNVSSRNATRLQKILDYMFGGICIFEYTGTIRPIYMNKGYYEMFEYNEEEYWKLRSGNVMANIFPEDVQEIVRRMRLAVKNNGDVEYTYRLRKRDGSTAMIQLRAVVLPESNGTNPMFLAIMHDVTSVRETQTHLKKMLEQQNLLLNNLPGGVVVFEVDDTLRVTYASEGIYRMIGITTQPIWFSSGMGLEDMIFPEDRVEFHEKLQECIHNNTEIEMVYPSKRGAGEGWTMAHGRLLQHEGDKKPQLCLLLWDITAQKKAELELKIQAERYSMLEETLQEILFDYDILNDCMLVTCRKNGELAHEQIQNYKAICHKVSKVPLVYASIYHRQFLEACQAPMRISFDVPVRSEMGEYRWHRVFLSSVAQERGKMVHVVGRAFDVHQETQERLAAEERAMRDQLTGLYNKIPGEMEVRRQLQKIKPDAEVAMLMVDLDGFKQVNDCFGHAFGDVVLMESASIIREVFPGDAILIRFGGDEIVVFMKLMSGDVQSLSNVLRKKLNEWENGKCKMHCSIGIACSTSKDFTELFTMADKAMYRAKGQGKNCIVVYSEETDL